jgi:glycosyltransferase involved in cell wall biosynthesis
MSDSAPGARKIVVNLRSQTAGLTGVQRYTQELRTRIEDGIETVAPRRPLHGAAGHLWEQAVLPVRVRKRLLWSPANTGPLAVERQVLTVHDVASLDHPDWFDSRFATWYRRMTPLLVRRVCRVITVSEFSKRRLIELTGIPESRVVVIPNGVCHRFHPCSNGEVERVRQKIGIPSTQYLLNIGSLEPRKNVATLLKAWQSSSASLPNNTWMVVAGAIGKEHVFRRADFESDGPRVLFCGFVADEDLPALYSGALAVVYPSIYEGFGLPVLEAMACGTVPIAANNTALPEVVGGAGILVDPLDTDAIADAIVRVVADDELRRVLGQCGIARSRLFSWERAADATWKVLSESSA